MRIRNLLCLLLRPVSIRRQTNLQLPATVRLLPRLEFRPHSTFAQSSDSCLSLEFAATEFFIFVFSFLLSLGFVRGGTVDELNLLGNKNWGKEEILRFLAENLRNLEKFFYGFAVKLDNLKCIIQSTIDSREITLEDFQPPLASKVVEALINNGGNTKVVFLENYKPSRKIKDLGDVGFELLQSFGSLLGEKLVGSKPNKVKNNVNP
ncbi:Tetratricopeptide repeat-like superfamily protein, putative isoform 1 [Cucumis melo var. makuwa]|uniref:Tetratricopeptide repeat-like superfamily protein, putative isoform 1 n=1 Tax=Cucumis melo var. makuwa TaxID=1194695 RepID=A0A5A7U7F6_CUCMM|nr:Tetratricopeptide repeat-like superfamily protein, putative isoform 1 [Cucumis melo var. makuwa]TYJ97930.1 Tetratricopeptide repeat-like superfamily protein, putative isoform 1 [Cucumis melo var. makuwa]